MQSDLPKIIDEFVTYKLNFDEQKKEKLIIWHDLLHKWQKKINLVSPQTMDRLWERHFMDSLQLGLYLSYKNNFNGGDLGSGAGFPGLALSLLGEGKITLMESDQRKSSFLRAVIREWGDQERIEVYNARIENRIETKFDIISARALAPLYQLLSYSLPLLNEQAYCLFLKGENYEKEILEAQKNWLFEYETYQSLTDKKAMILKIRNIKEKL